jgi:hypothetical protein
VLRGKFGQSGTAAVASALAVEPAGDEGGTAATAAFLVAPEPVIDPSGRARFADAPPAFTPGRRSDFVRAGIQSTSPAQFAGASTAAARDDALLVWLAGRPSVGKQAIRHSPSASSNNPSPIGDNLLAGTGSLVVNEWDRAFELLMLDFQNETDR